MRSPLASIFLIVLVDVLGLTIVYPLLAIYAESFHATAFTATLLGTTYAVCQLFSAPWLGSVSDRMGRRPMLLVSQVGTFLGFLLMARATSLWMLFVARAIDGATAGNLSIAQAYISDNTKPQNRARAFALIGIAFGLGFFLGPFITARLSKYGLSAPIYAAAALSFTSILCTFFLLPKEVPHPDDVPEATSPGGKRLTALSWGDYRQFFQRPRLAGLLFQFLAYMLAFQTFISGFALFAERRFTWDGHRFTPREIGYLFAYVGVLGIILQGGVVGRLVKRFGEGKLMRWGFGSLTVGYTALGFIFRIPYLVAASTMSSFGNAVLRPSLTSLITQSANRREQGVVLGLTSSLSSVAAIFAPPIAGLLIEHGLLVAWAGVAGLWAVVGLLLAPLGSARQPAIEVAKTA